MYVSEYMGITSVVDYVALKYKYKHDIVLGE